MIRGLAAALCAAALACGGADGPTDTEPAPGQAPGAASESTAAPHDDDSDHDDPEGARLRAVEVAVNEHSAAMHDCWGQAAAETLDLAGEMVFEVEIGEGGEPADLDVVRDTAEDETLRACLVGLWSEHQFPAGVFEPGEVLRLPPLRFVAQDVQYAIPARHIEPRDIAGGAGQARVILRENNTGNQDASISLLEIEPDAQVELPAGEGTTAVVFAVSGRGRISGPGLPDDGAPLSAEDAAVAPDGAALSARAEGDAPLELLVSYAPAGPEAELVRAEGGAGAPDAAAAEVALVRKDDAATYSIAAGLGEATIYHGEDAPGSPRASLTLLEASPGMVVPPHVHEGASEYLYLLSGEGAMTAGDQEFRVGARTAIQVPEGTEHGVEVVSDEPLRAVQIYAPAGPEQRFVGER